MPDLEGRVFRRPSDFVLGDGEEWDLSEFHACRFVGLEQGAFPMARRLRFFGCQFEDCNLSNWRVPDFTARDCIFKSSKLVGINWCEASALVLPRFEDCKLDHSTFQKLDLRRVFFGGSSLREVDFAEARLVGADFRDCDLQGASFRGADVQTADLREARNYFIEPQFTKVKGLRCSSAAALSFLVALGIKVEG
jgi:uncharacterized protein YjbI with pentapeptide repeats